jgi:hypothetical protein
MCLTCINAADWLPNHLLVIHILLVFAVINPLVLPFGLLYFTVERSAFHPIACGSCATD